VITRRIYSGSVLAAVMAVAVPLFAQSTAKQPANATGQCTDGTYTTAKTQSGACSKHGGVKTWYGGGSAASTAKTAPAAKTPAAPTSPAAPPKSAPAGKTAAARPANATAQCTDGTYSTAKTKTGACSKHGGVAQWFADTGAAAPAPAPAPAPSAMPTPTPKSTPTTAATAAPADATGQCADGTYTRGKSEQGACSRHGGVKTWFASGAPASKSVPAPPAGPTNPPPTSKAAPPAAPAAPSAPVSRPANAPQDATARCKDGTYSHAKGHTGACSHHGGVAEWYK
jgi:hypothetical protein